MKKLALMAIVLCTCATFVCHEDTESAKKGRRTVEPRLSGAAEWQPCQRKPLAYGHVVEETRCGPVAAVPAKCEEIAQTARQAAQLLSSSPQCLDTAIETLVRASRIDNSATSDRAAAYYLRAQRDDEPADLLLAFEAAEQAVGAAPDLSSAWFNRALIVESLGVPEEAIASWNRFLTLDHSDWANEARARRDRLMRELANTDAIRWQRSRNALTIALRAGDRNTVARLIEPFPSAAQRYFEEELLPEWAALPTRESLDRVRLFASVLSERLKDDPFPTDIVAAIDNASVSQLVALREGHLAFQRARRAEMAFAPFDYTIAEQLLRRGGSPLYLRAGLSTAYSEADRLGYRHLVARARWRRANPAEQNDFMEAFREYDAVLRQYAQSRDYEGLATIHAHLAGVFKKIGHRRNAWREAFYATHHASRIIENRYRQARLSEASYAAADLGFPSVALLYQNEAVRLAENDAPGYVAIALRARSDVQLKLQRPALAAADLARAQNATDKTAGNSSSGTILSPQSRRSNRPTTIPPPIKSRTASRSSINSRMPRSARAARATRNDISTRLRSNCVRNRCACSRSGRTKAPTTG
jgi:hypothetical protein